MTCPRTLLALALTLVGCAGSANDPLRDASPSDVSFADRVLVDSDAIDTGVAADAAADVPATLDAALDSGATCTPLPPAPSCSPSAPAAMSPIAPGDLRGMFWKQWKDPGGDDHAGLHYPADFGFDRSSLIRFIVERGDVNAIVVDLNELPADQDLPGVARFIATLYRVQRCMLPSQPPPVRVYLHNRRYFHWSTSPDEDPKFDEFASDVARTFAAVRAVDPDALSIIDGVRWGENGDTDMEVHLRNAVYLADRINAATSDWLVTHSFVINGLGFGASFAGLAAADTVRDYDANVAGMQSFADAIRRRARTFSWAYKHFYNEGGVGIGMLFESYCADHGLSTTDPASWQSMFHGLFGFNALAGWLNTHSDLPRIANVIYIGDSGDGANRTAPEATIAIGDEFAAMGQHGRVFMLPFGLEGAGYYDDRTVTTWLSPSSTDPSVACASTSPGDMIWRTTIR